MRFPVWSKLPARFVARMLSSHAALGLAASALLYIVCVSGTVMVFHQEFARWEQPAIAEFEHAAPDAVQAAALTALERTLATTGEKPHFLYLSLPLADMPRMTVTADDVSWYVNAQGELIDKVSHDWTEFLVKLHFYLTLPGVWGLTLVGIMGILLLGLVLSGLFAHPRLFRDAFKLRLGSGRRLRETDIHNRLSVWATPFHLVIAFTGAAIGLGSVVALVMASTFMDSNTESFYAPIFGAAAVENSQPAPLADASAALNNLAEQYPNLNPWYVNFAHPATVGQGAELLVKFPNALLYGDEFEFNQAGELTHKLGLSDGFAGQQIVAALYPLHFGSFGTGVIGSLLVKLAYAVLGIALCVVIVSGINIWLLKRRQRGHPAPRLEAVWRAIVWGTLTAMAVVLLIEALGFGAIAGLITVFWVVLVLAIVLAVIFPRWQLTAGLQWLAALMLLTIVVLHFVRFSGAYDRPVVVSVSGCFLLFAGWLMWRARYRKRVGFK
ncbi:MAG TPA: PepSY-associated TM helix domain-containing protein [Gammaproteobacteria bacterium]|nr:PepSY-associated TM helix domain-containing protein [Gammaproteobacteria bacterium]